MQNAFFWVILISLLANYALDVTVNILNLRALRLSIPPSLEGIYDAEAYRKSQEYTRINTRFELIAGTVHLSLILAFWFTGGFNYLDGLIRGFGFPPVINGLLYIGTLALLNGLVMLPFNIYHTFVIEGRFGFNRTTPGTYVSDLFKGAVLAVLLGAPLIAGFIMLFEYFGQIAWFYCFIGVVLFIIAVQYVTPVLIMPLFNKFTPLTDEKLKNAIMDYAHSVGYRVGGIFVMNGSKRSTRGNAFFTGFGRYKRIAIFDTLMGQLAVPELVAVLAHEIGHYKYKHVLIGMLLSIIQTGLILYLLSFFIYSPGLYQSFGMDTPSLYAGLVFFSLLFTPLEMVLSVISEAISRRDETQADRFAAVTVPEPEALVTALEKLTVNNLTNLTPHPLYVFLTYSHPPLMTRIRTIREAEKKRKENAESVPAGRS
jgi:STE24 endopeptidase